jgi:DNA-binding NarL/FixJ family response regulator
MQFRALLVESNIELSKRIKDILESKLPFLSVDVAVSDRETFQQIKVNEPDVIIMEISLPSENGLELAQKVKRLYPQIRLVINTDSDSPEYNTEATHIGADYFLSKKSNTINDLVSVVVALYSAAKGDKQNYVSECT